MAIDLFRVSHGLAIEADDSSTEIYMLQGPGAPGGDAAEQDAAPIGSLFLRTNAEADNLQLYYKWTLVNNSAADWKQSTSKEYVDAIANGLSWREPVVVKDDTLYANAAAFPITGTIDGVTLSDGDRVLFGNVTLGTDENIFIWDASGTSWTEDTNAETDGDAVLVQQGSFAEQQWVYDGANWVQFGSSAGAAELGYIRAFIGKTGAGSEMPTYSSTSVVTSGANLEVAIGEVDAVIGDGDITNTGANWVISSDGTWAPTPGSNDITTLIDELNSGIGDRTYTEDNVVVDGEAVASSIDALDIAIGDLNSQNQSFNSVNITTITPVDIIAVAAGELVKWMVIVENTADATNRIAYEILAMHDGAGTADLTKYAKLKLGSNITGLTLGVDVSAGNLRLLITSTQSVDVGGKRLGVISAN